jgi:hypothetical protein
MLNKKIVFLFGLVLIFSGCGGGGGSKSSNISNSKTPAIKEDKSLKVNAVDHLNSVVQKDFNGYKIVLFTNKKLDESKELSKETKAVYGTINNKPTNALIKINANYDNATFIIKVYKNSQLVGQSKKFKLTPNKEFVNFGKITTIK